jgi:hypothetical protein
LLPVKALSKIFRGKFRRALQKTALFAQILSKVWQQDWVVHCKAMGNGRTALKYLAPYVFRVAISNHRLVKLENDQVTFSYRATDSIGRTWAGVDSHLWRYDPASDNWYEFAAPDPPIADMRFGFIDSLAIDADNSAWPVLILCGGASCYGNSVLYHFHDEQWTQVGEVGEFDGGYWGPVFDAAGMAWLY